MTWGMCPSTVVSTGVSAPRKAWRTMTARSPRPLARAVRTQSSPRDSRQAERVCSTSSPQGPPTHTTPAREGQVAQDVPLRQ